MQNKISGLCIFLITVFIGHAQNTHSYNLAEMLNKNDFLIDTSNHAQILQDPDHKNAISLQRVAWLKNITFKDGTIDIDLRGKDVFLQSFLGIAFNAKDMKHYEVIYFRPFNFKHPDTNRRRWSVQYMQVPDFTYDKLRKEHPLVYENSVTPVPRAEEWFHATIVISADSAKVYVNHSAECSLAVKRLVNNTVGMIGLWDDELSGDFANLKIEGAR
ncbi:MAG TPA: hypothetical protein VFV08_16800 [Puia sp.]|nr:hypothetical protein [Puia sp.]